jgi:hypothetical protein
MKACSGSLQAAKFPDLALVFPSAPPAGSGGPPRKLRPPRWSPLAFRSAIRGDAVKNQASTQSTSSPSTFPLGGDRV